MLPIPFLTLTKLSGYMLSQPQQLVLPLDNFVGWRTSTTLHVSEYKNNLKDNKWLVKKKQEKRGTGKLDFFKN